MFRIRTHLVVRLFYWKPGADEGETIPLLPIRDMNSRSLGVADMAHALHSGRPHRANGEMAFHILDIMHTILDASQTGMSY